MAPTGSVQGRTEPHTSTTLPKCRSKSIELGKEGGGLAEFSRWGCPKPTSINFCSTDGHRETLTPLFLDDHRRVS